VDPSIASAFNARQQFLAGGHPLCSALLRSVARDRIEFRFARRAGDPATAQDDDAVPLRRGFMSTRIMPSFLPITTMSGSVGGAGNGLACNARNSAIITVR
jgi:hypothetical protein